MGAMGSRGRGGRTTAFLTLPQVDHFCFAIVVKRKTKSLDEQREEGKFLSGRLVLLAGIHI